MTAGPSCVDGSYPDYGNVIPTSYEFSVPLPTKDLIDACQSARKLECQHLKMKYGPASVTISAESEVGEVSRDIPYRFVFAEPRLSEYSEGPLTISFNPKRLRECVKSIGSEEVWVHLRSPLVPVKFTSDRRGFVLLLMPVRA